MSRFKPNQNTSPVKVFRELRMSSIVLDHLVEIIILILIIIIFSTEGALRLPTTYDNHPSNQTHFFLQPIPSNPSDIWL